MAEQQRDAVPLTTIKHPTGMYPEAIAYLKGHGCTFAPGIRFDVIEFPEGTTEERTPLGHIEPQYKINLPDGTMFYRRHLRARANPDENGLSLLLLPENAY